MKRLIVIALAIVCGVAFSESFAKKPKKVELTEAEKEELRIQEEKELQEIQEQMYLDSIKLAEKKRELEAELKRMEMELEYSRSKTRGPLPVYEEMELPCQEEAQSTDEYYAAWAASDGQPNESFAVQEAMLKAQSELAKQIGGEDVVLENVAVVCRMIMRDKYGNYKAYVAVRMPKNKQQ